MIGVAVQAPTAHKMRRIRTTRLTSIIGAAEGNIGVEDAGTVGVEDSATAGVEVTGPGEHSKYLELLTTVQLIP